MGDDAETRFPASENVPGQQQSRRQYNAVQERLRQYAWFEDYLELRRCELRGRKLDWRKAVYVAWASMPSDKREPPTQEELAKQILGLRSAHSVSAWKRKFPELDDLVAERQAAPLFKYRADIFDALAQVARMVDPRAHQDRKLALEMLGDYKPKTAIDVSGDMETEQVVKLDVSGLPPEVLRAIADGGAGGAVADGCAESVSPAESG